MAADFDSDMQLDITTIGDYQVVKLTGKIGWEHAHNLDKQINYLIGEGHRKIVFNLDEVSFICSGAIGSILYNMNKFKGVGGGIYLIAASEYVNMVFKSAFGALVEGAMFESFDEFRQRVMDQ